MGKRNRQGLGKPSSPFRYLVVSDGEVEDDTGGNIASWICGAVSLGFEDLNCSALQYIAPHTVVVPAVAENFDCIDAATRLSNSGFRGRVWIIPDDLPRPDMVADELSASFPTLDISLAPPARTAGSGEPHKVSLASRH